MREAERFRELAAWYREFAERAGNPSIWESRLLMAEDLEQEADRLDRHAAEPRGKRLQSERLTTVAD
jgi:hypothetical protein